MSGHTPIMLLTTSTSPKWRRPVSIALRRDCLDCIQSQCSALLRQVTMNSVIKKGSSVPKTADAVFVSSVRAIGRNFIARPGNTDIYSAGRQDKLLTQTFNQFVAPTQLQHIDGGRNLIEHKELRISVSGSIRSQVFSKRVLSLPNN